MDDSVNDAATTCEGGQLNGLVEGSGGGFLGVDVLSSLDGLAQGLMSSRGCLGIEVNVDVVAGHDGVDVGGNLLESVSLGDMTQFRLVAPDEDGLDLDRRAVGGGDAPPDPEWRGSI